MTILYRILLVGILGLSALNSSFAQKKKDKKPSEWYNESIKFKNDSMLKYGETLLKDYTLFYSSTRVTADKYVHIFLAYDYKVQGYFRVFSVVDKYSLKELYQMEMKPQKKEGLQRIIIDDDKLYAIYKDYKTIKGKGNKNKFYIRIKTIDLSTKDESELKVKFDNYLSPSNYSIKDGKLWFLGHASYTTPLTFCNVVCVDRDYEYRQLLGYIDLTSGEMVKHEEKNAKSALMVVNNSDTSDNDLMVLKVEYRELKKKKKNGKKKTYVVPTFYKVNTEDNKIELKDELVFDDFPDEASVGAIRFNQLNEKEIAFYGMYYDDLESYIEKEKKDKKKEEKKKDKRIKLPITIYFKTYKDQEKSHSVDIKLHDLKEYEAIQKKIRKIAKDNIDKVFLKGQLQFNFYDMLETDDTFVISFSISHYEVNQDYDPLRKYREFESDEFLIHKNIGLVMICVTKEGKVVWDRFIEHKMKSKGGKSESYYSFEWVNSEPTYIYKNDKNEIMALSLDPDGKLLDKRLKLRYKPRKIKKEELIDIFNVEDEMVYTDSSTFVCVGSYYIDKQTVFDKEGEPKEDDDSGKKKKKKKSSGPKTIYSNKYLLVYLVSERVDMEDKPIPPPPPPPVETATKKVEPVKTTAKPPTGTAVKPNTAPKTTTPAKPPATPAIAPKK